jgi:biopolymer transport protein TolR
MGFNVRPDDSSLGDDMELLAEINVTPFVDVMLVLLIVFMVTAPMLTSGVSVDLPDTEAAALSQSDDTPVEVTLDRMGKIYIASTEVSREKLMAALDEATKSKKDSKIYIRADEVLDYGAVMDILGSVNRAGYSKVALMSNTKQR